MPLLQRQQTARGCGGGPPFRRRLRAMPPCGRRQIALCFPRCGGSATRTARCPTLATTSPAATCSWSYLQLEQRSAPLQAVPRGADGEVVPAVTAAKVWPSAYAMLRAMEERGGEVAGLVRRSLSLPAGAREGAAGSRVLELGAGTGLAGMSGALLGASHVALTDLPENLPLLRRNAALNRLAGDGVEVAALDWTKPPPEALLAGGWDLILAADCVFWEVLFDPLIATLQALLAAATPSAAAYLTATHRQARLAEFLRRLDGTASLEREALPLPLGLPGTELHRVTLRRG
mmetsp:Transcript_21548/g.68570  ORF Transcript_21548/g.68570 Transcript_21548/m.68570 type:complete len:290 (-) Transcript_21548:108-977(-)